MQTGKENGVINMVCESEFIDSYNDWGISVRKIRQRLNISHEKFYEMRTKLVDEGKIEPRPFKRQKRQRHIPKHYSYSHASEDFKIWRNGIYYGCVKTIKQAKKFVELLEANNWNVELKDELKKEAMRIR